MIELSDESYVDFINSTDEVIFLNFYSPYCGPCQELKPIVEELSLYYRDRAVSICRVDISKNPKLRAKYRVTQVPLSVVIGVDKMVKEAEVGLRAIDLYYKMVDRLIEPKRSIFDRVKSFFKK